MRNRAKLFTLLALLLTACAGGDQHTGGNQIARRDRIDMAFNMQTGQPIPEALPDPGRWISLGTETIQGQRQTMVWVKPVAMTPRAAVASPIDASKAVQLFRPLESFSREWTERFEYQDLPRPSVTPAAYLDVFRDLQARNCPSGTVEPLRVESAELLLEARSGGCAAFGEQDEIDRFIFGQSDMFHMIYVVKAHEMTEAQRAIGLKAVNAWNLAP